MSNTASDLAIVGGRVVDAATGVDEESTCVIESGVITHVGPDVDIPPQCRIIDATGLLVLPGIIDSHCHLYRAGADRSFGHERMVRAGVTTAVEFSNFDGVADQWNASTVGLSVLGLQALPALPDDSTDSTIRTAVGEALSGGAFGVKIFGGHYPSSPRVTARMIRSASEMGAYVGVHVGTTSHGSNLDGVVEAIDLAEGLPFHLAHTNSYLRGAVADPVEENQRLLSLLVQRPEIRSEAYLGSHNSCRGGTHNGIPTDEITGNCLELGGYERSVEGLLEAFDDEYAFAQVDTGVEFALRTGAEGARLWRGSAAGGSLSFPVNLQISAFMQTCARISPQGRLTFQGPGRFVVDAISSDGGQWRNVILERGLGYVALGALTLAQFVEKACLRPAQLYGLDDRGAIRTGARGDVLVVDGASRKVRSTIINGNVVYDEAGVHAAPGEVLTTSRGVARMEREGIPHSVIDPRSSILARTPPSD